MDIVLDIRKTIEENAASYFEAAKKAKRKLEGAGKALLESRKKLDSVLQMDAESKKSSGETKKAEKKWFEKFRWFISSEGFLCIGGRDATSNEVVVRKHADAEDVVFHTEMAGSPFFVVKTGGKAPGKATLEEAAIAAASFSRAWKLGLPVAETFYVNPEQLSKTPKAGEHLEKGAFIINGKVNHITAEIKLAIGVTEDGRVMCGPAAAVEKNCTGVVGVTQGDDKPSSAAKRIISRLKLGRDCLDDVIRALPSGGLKLA